MFDFCQVCRHYDIVGNKCSKAPKRAIPKSRCADYEFHTHEDLCKYCSHNNYGRCTVGGEKCNEVLAKIICADFENKANMNKKMEYEKKEWLCAQCANKCKAAGGMDYCDKFIDEEEAERTANTKRIEEIRKRCEEFMHDIVRDFGSVILADTPTLSEKRRNVVLYNKEKDLAYMDSEPFIDFSLKFTVYNKD